MRESGCNPCRIPVMYSTLCQPVGFPHMHISTRLITNTWRAHLASELEQCRLNDQ